MSIPINLIAEFGAAGVEILAAAGDDTVRLIGLDRREGEGDGTLALRAVEELFIQTVDEDDYRDFRQRFETHLRARRAAGMTEES